MPNQFLHAFQRRWREETGGAWNVNSTTESLFKVMVKKAMPLEVQKRLERVVGLMKMDWPMFSEHLIHHVETVRKERQKEEDAHKSLTSKLAQLQLSELSSKQKKEKAKTQAPVVTAEQAQTRPTANTANQGVPPVQTLPQTSYPQAMFMGPFPDPPPHPQNPPTAQHTQPQLPALHSPNQPTSLMTPFPPAIYVQVGQHEPTLNRPRGQPGPRRGPYRCSAWNGRPLQRGDRAQSTPQLNEIPNDRDVCWGCHKRGHQRRDCPDNPWTGPANQWP